MSPLEQLASVRAMLGCTEESYSFLPFLFVTRLPGSNLRLLPFPPHRGRHSFLGCLTSHMNFKPANTNAVFTRPRNITPAKTALSEYGYNSFTDIAAWLYAKV